MTSPPLSRGTTVPTRWPIPGLLRAVGRIEAMDEVALDIDEVEGVPPPDRAFAPLAADVSNRFGADHGGMYGHGAARTNRKIANAGLSKRRAAWQDVCHAKRGPRDDVWKVWLYAAASVALGAWISPLLYNAGKALAEVSLGKTTNGPLEWLAGCLPGGGVSAVFRGSGVAGGGGLLFFPWMEWIHARRGDARPGRDRGAAAAGRRAGGGARPALEKNPQGWWHCAPDSCWWPACCCSMGVALVPAGFSRWLPDRRHGDARAEDARGAGSPW
jgi:hypothetical protein